MDEPPAPAPSPRAVRREVGRRVVASMRRTVAVRLAEAWRSDPERLDTAVELGIVNPEWVESPGEQPFASAAPIEVVERFLQRTADERPSVWASLGLNALSVLASTSEEATPTSRGRPVQLAIMFTDLEGFTAFTATMGDEQASQLLDTHHRQVASVVRRYGGRIVKRLGDGLLLRFDGAGEAVSAGAELIAGRPADLRLRAGAHLGDVLLSRRDVVGHVVNVAARVADRARGGELLVTAELRSAAGEVPGVTFGRPRRYRFKGVADKVDVCSARAASLG